VVSIPPKNWRSRLEGWETRDTHLLTAGARAQKTGLTVPNKPRGIAGIIRKRDKRYVSYLPAIAAFGGL
jgi:hypothetical protein